MESIIIVILGIAFTILSKNAKQKKEVDAEKERRRKQLQSNPQQSSYDYMGETKEESRPDKQKSLKELFMDEINKLENEDDTVGKTIRSFRGEDSSRKQESSNEKSMDDRSLEKKHLDDEEYYERLHSRVGDYDERDLKEHIVKRSGTSSPPKEESRKIQNNRKYNPFTKSINKNDIIRGIIFSEVIDKPKSMKNMK